MATLPQVASAIGKTPATAPAHAVYIHQSHTGDVLGTTPHSAEFFDYYEPVEIVPEMISRILAASDWPTKMAWTQKRAWGANAFEALSLSAKLVYLTQLESHFLPRRTWQGRRSLILRRKPGAPTWLDQQPLLQMPPGTSPNAALSYQFPELASGPDFSEQSVDEVIHRAEEVIRGTGFSTSQFSVHLRIAPERLEAQSTALFSAFQEINDELYLEASLRGLENTLPRHSNPWESGHAVRALEQIRSRAPHEADPSDPFDPSGPYLGLKFWGTTGGDLLVSFELRGAGVEWESKERNRITFPKIRGARYHLERVHRLAISLVAGTAETRPMPGRYFDAEYAKQKLSEYARILRDSARLPSLESFSRKVLGRENPAMILFPFSRPGESNRALDAYAFRLAEILLQENTLDTAGLAEAFYDCYEDYAESELRRMRSAPQNGILGSQALSCPAEILNSAL